MQDFSLYMQLIEKGLPPFWNRSFVVDGSFLSCFNISCSGNHQGVIQLRNRTRVTLSLSVLALFCLAAASSARANEVYDLTLSANPPQYGGSGILTLSQAPGSGNSVFTSGGGTLTLSLEIDGVTFNASGCTADYTNSVLDTIYGCAFLPVSGDAVTSLYASGTSGGYQVHFPSYGSNGGYISGLFTIGPGVDPPPVPEPSSLLLLGAGLLSLMGTVYGRRKVA
jgi:hypothetical protein